MLLKTQAACYTKPPLANPPPQEKEAKLQGFLDETMVKTMVKQFLIGYRERHLRPKHHVCLHEREDKSQEGKRQGPMYVIYTAPIAAANTHLPARRAAPWLRCPRVLVM